MLHLVLSAALSLALGAAPPVADPLAVPQAELDAEVARLQALGLDVDRVGLARPWDEPLTRRSLVVPASWFAKPGDTVKASALLADLPILEKIMGRAYGGWLTAEARGWHWDKWHSEWRAALAKEGNKDLPMAEAFAPVKALIAFQLDNHTNIPLHSATRFGSGSRSVVVDGHPKAACTAVVMKDGTTHTLDDKDPAQRVRHVQRWNGKALQPVSYLALPTAYGEPTTLRCGATSHELSAVATAHPEVNEPTLTKPASQIAYLRLPTFSKANTQLIERNAPSWPKPAGEKALIVDLRDNDGGDVAIEALQGWIADERLEDAFKDAVNAHRTEGASCLYTALRWGYTVFTSRGLSPPLTPGVQEQLQHSLDELAQASDEDCLPRFTDSRSGWDYRQHKVAPPGPVEKNRRIIVVVNNACGSDCELMAMVLARLPETVVVGSNTFGVAQYIQPGYGVLPNTRLPFRIALGSADNYGDDRSFDGYGFDVDVLLSDAASQSQDALIALARHYAKKG